MILPGYTHFQRAQPVLAPHYWLAYCEKFERDRLRLADCRRRTNVLPLGAAALAGTSLPIDRADVANRLGFEGVAANSLDAVSDRDFALEFAFVLAVIAEHLSTWAEEWILWSTAEFNFLKLPQAFCTGSSIMPQKINPDVLELIRGKTARVIGNLQTLLVLVKGLPLAYNRDLQEDKPPLFDSFDAVRASLELAAPLAAGAELNREAIAERLDRGHLDATTLMEHLIRRGVPQRTAHELVGRLVRKALDRGVRLADLSLAEFREADPELDASVYDVLGPEKAVAAMMSYGSTAPKEVKKQVQRWKEKLAQERRKACLENLPSPFGRGAGGEGRLVRISKSTVFSSLRPHPNPLPEGEGTKLPSFDRRASRKSRAMNIRHRIIVPTALAIFACSLVAPARRRFRRTRRRRRRSSKRKWPR